MFPLMNSKRAILMCGIAVHENITYDTHPVKLNLNLTMKQLLLSTFVCYKKESKWWMLFWWLYDDVFTVIPPYVQYLYLRKI